MTPNHFFPVAVRGNHHKPATALHCQQQSICPPVTIRHYGSSIFIRADNCHSWQSPCRTCNDRTYLYGTKVTKNVYHTYQERYIYAIRKPKEHQAVMKTFIRQS